LARSDCSAHAGFSGPGRSAGDLTFTIPVFLIIKKSKQKVIKIIKYGAFTPFKHLPAERAEGAEGTKWTERAEATTEREPKAERESKAKATAKWESKAEATAEREPCRCRYSRYDHCDESSDYCKYFLEHTSANLLQ
jgi:hypothetical protein